MTGETAIESGWRAGATGATSEASEGGAHETESTVQLCRTTRTSPRPRRFQDVIAGAENNNGRKGRDTAVHSALVGRHSLSQFATRSAHSSPMPEQGDMHTLM